MVAEQLEEGTVLNERYRIRGALGRGGMGTVYMADHVRLDTIVAVKEVRRQSAGPDAENFDFAACESEARILVRLNHAFLPKVTDAFLENDRFYLVMEYIEGATLEALLREESENRVSVLNVVQWALQIAEVLDYLHQQTPPVIFRDMKPANVMLQPDGSIRLIDFGIARRFQVGAIKDTALLGSVGYSPPEQFGKQQTDARSDIYAFAATLHHLLTRRDPMATPFKFPQARSLNSLVPESLSMLLTWCLQMEPEARPADIGIVSQRLKEIQEEITQVAIAPLPSNSDRSDAPSNRRIVSSQLARYETRNRPKSAPSATAVAVPHWKYRLGLTVTLLILICGGTLAVLKSHRAAPSSVNVTLPPIIPRAPEYTPFPSPSPTTGSTDSSPDQPPVVDTSTQISALAGPTIQDTVGLLLPIRVQGTLRGHRGARAVIAVYFYQATPENKPLPALDQSGNWVSPDGQLSVAVQFSVKTDSEPFDQILQIPLSQFPPESGPLRYRALVSVGQQKVYSNMMDLNSEMMTPGGTTGADGTAGPNQRGPQARTSIGASILGRRR